MRRPKAGSPFGGGGIHTSQLFSETILGKAGLACIFDNDSKKHGSKLNGHEIRTFIEDPTELKSTIDSILISSEASEDIIFEQIAPLEKFGIKIYRLYHELEKV